MRSRSDIYNRLGKNKKGEILLIKDYRFSSDELICENIITNELEHYFSPEIELMNLKLKDRVGISLKDKKEMAKNVFGKNGEYMPQFIQTNLMISGKNN